jgi:hypothetical protein
MRFWASPIVYGPAGRKGFVSSPMNILDLVAILPFYVSLALADVESGGFRVVRVVRLVRLFRLLRLGPFQIGIALLSRTMEESARTLMVLLFIMCIVVLIFAVGIYYIEKWGCPHDLLTNYGYYYTPRRPGQLSYVEECRNVGTQGFTDRLSDYPDLLCCEVIPGTLSEVDTPEKQRNARLVAKGFRSITESFWWSLVTVTTVGYGDIAPKTIFGKMVGVVVMISGILVLSLPVGIVGSKFQDAYNDLDREMPQLKFVPRLLKNRAHFKLKRVNQRRMQKKENKRENKRQKKVFLRI